MISSLKSCYPAFEIIAPNSTYTEPKIWTAAHNSKNEDMKTNQAQLQDFPDDNDDGVQIVENIHIEKNIKHIEDV